MAGSQPQGGITFDHLSDGEFEEFTYDLLSSLGFINLSWRRGTGKGGATADQGRDIEADLSKREIDKVEFLEKYFVQAKHYKEGVPPAKLQDAFTWAVAARPHVLLIVASNALSNSAKNWIKEYEQNNKPGFRIKIWERKELEGLLASNAHLIKKYKLGSIDPAAGLHPAHLQYIHHPPSNTLEQLFSILDSVDPKKRDDVFAWDYHFVISPRYRKPKHPGETMGELMLDPVDYESFKKKFLQLAEQTSDIFLAYSFVSHALAFLANFADPGKIGRTIEYHKRLIEHLSEQKPTALITKEMIDSQVERVRELMETIPDRQKNYEANYEFICEVILPRLAIEDLGPQDDESPRVTK